MGSYVDIAIVLIFLALNVIVGLKYGAGVKDIKDYALGGRNFSTGALVSTIVATWVGGGTFFLTVSKTYSSGLYYVIASLGVALSLFLTAYILIPRMGELLGKTSIAELMGDLYGKNVRLIVAITGLIGATGGIAIQFKAFGNIFGYFLGIENYIAVIVAGCIVTTYSAFGGVRAVTFTDVLQFITFGVAMPLIGIMIWQQLNHPSFSFARVLQEPKFNFKTVLNLGNPKFWEMIPLMLYFLIPELEPVFCQRISIGRNLRQVKKAFLIAGFVLIFIKLTIAWIPFLIYNIDSNLAPNDLLSYIIDNFTRPGLKGLMIIGVTALAMSTADSYINISSVLFANDICKPLNLGMNRELALSRIFAFVLGIGGILLALTETDLLQIILTASSFYMPIATVPILMTILGFRSSAFSVLTGMIAGFSTVIAWNILDIEMDCIFFAMVVNLVFLTGSHYLLKQPGGWVGAKDKTYLENARAERNKKFTKLASATTNFSFVEFIKKHAPANEVAYTGLGIYCFFYTITTMYSTDSAFINSDNEHVLTIFKIMMVTSVLFAMYPIWPPKIKHDIIVQTAWNIVIFYMLIFFSGYFALLNKFGSLPLVVFTLNLVIVAILTGWRLALPMVIIGFYLSVKLYKYSFGLREINFDIGSMQAVLVYTLLLAGTAVAIFLRPKQERQDLIEEKVGHLSGRVDYQASEIDRAMDLKNEFIRNIKHEYHAPMTGIISNAETLWKHYDDLPDKLRKRAAEDIYKSMIRLDRFDSNINDLARLEKPTHELNKEVINLSELVEDRIENCIKFYVDEGEKENRSFDIYIQPNLKVECDKYFIEQTLDNLIINAIMYCKMGEIKISLKKALDQIIEFQIQDEGIGVPAQDLEDIFKAFIVSSRTHTPAGGRGIGLALCKKVIDMHGGTIRAQSNGIKGAIFKFSLPR